MALAGGSAMILQEFSTAKCTFKVYKQVFENKMRIHNIDEVKWPQYLISCIGFDIVTLLTELCFPSTLDSKNYKQLVELIETHIEPTQSEITETYKFMKRVQLPNESIAEYVAALKKLAQTCNYGAHLERSLRDKFVHGLRNENIVKRLFNEDKLTFTTAVNIAIGMELAEKGARLITNGQEEVEVQKVSHQKENKETVKLKCHCCGKLGHMKPKCRFREEECYKCHKKGHIASVCRAQVNLHKRFPSRKVKEVNKDEFSVLQVKSDEFSVLQVKNSVYSENENYDYGLELLFYQNEDNVKVNKVTLIDEKCPDPWNISLNVNNVDILFQIDCGSDVTLMPEFLYKSLLPNVKVSNCFSKITGYGGQYITVIGKTQVLVKNKNKDYLAPLIIVKEGKKPLLGRDWLSVIKIDWNSCKKQCNSIEREKFEIKRLVDKYRDIFSGVPGEIKGTVGTLKLKENVTPICCKPRRVPYALENLVKGELDKLCNEGKMCKVDEQDEVTWATPIVSIIKGPKNIRICGDYKVTINPYLEMPHHPIPVIEDIFAKLNKDDNNIKTVFSKIDLRKAYMNRRMDGEAQKLMTLTTPWGLYRPTFMMFGMASAPQEWQDFMDKHFNMPNVYCFIDDILVASCDVKSHLKTLECIFDKLRTLNIKINKDKTVLMSSQLEYCGHVIDKDGVHKTPEHVKAILEAPQPRNVKELRSFLGTINFYHKFLKNAAENLKPLYQLLKNSGKWEWGKGQVEAYEWAKKAIASDQVLVHYNPKLPVILSCDASKYGLGACLAHEIKIGNVVCERPIAFASRTLNDAETKYSQIDKEALAIIWAVKKFDLYLKGRTFTLVTYHKPLISIFNPSKTASSIYADRMTRWSLILSNYNYIIKYRTSQNNAAADFPSRLPINNSSEDDKSYLEGNINSIVLDNPPVTLTDVAKHTQRDPVLSKVLTYLREGWPRIIDKELLNFKGKERELYVIKDCIIWRDRIVIPNSLKAKVLIELHAGHLGINKMQALANSCFWWPNISNDIKDITSNCKGCIQNRNLPPLKHLHNWEWPNEPWKRLHADFAGPFMGHMWLIVMDAHSKWPEVAKMKLTTSSATIKCLRSIFARFGLPEQFVTDNGPQWTSAEFITFCKNNNIRHICTAPYHPASNGLAERGVQTFKKAMLAQTFNNKDLDHSVQQWLLAYRSAPHATTGRAPCELMLGRQLRTRLSLIKKDVTIPRQSVCSKPVKQYLPGDKVLVASYDKSRKWLEGIIDGPVGNVMYNVNTDKGILTRNVTQCLPRNSRADQDEFNNSQDMIENDIPGNEVSLNATSGSELETSNNSTNSSNAFNNNNKDSVSNPKSPIGTQTEVRRSGRMRKPVQRLNL
ncbi:unnamed protein product [Euphydryas editha]|uniref:RNA-directed DNA polymerase n=1 Tax=Euphydryas editha TaxID=104508 RepID=A0AAU9TM25_EUPED|nr:unnamed protein product [Euphydryas editha]